eukprot:GHVU01222331.1.p1 GENE.GHVU01222331.1~~GHVU01222331.1.p1  ORF type:complete len:208 (+),score=19.84 GHVU01222331.1:98-721(+)
MAQYAYDVLVKALIVGDSGVGKTALLGQFTKNSFPTSHLPTIGIDFKVKTLNMGDTKAKLQVWDTAGQERFRSITTNYYRSAHGVIIVYDVSNQSTYDSLDYWISQVREHADKVPIVLVGNKCDLQKERVVKQSTAEKKAEDLHLPFIETSALEEYNINEAFRAIVNAVQNNNNKQKQPKIDNYSIKGVSDIKLEDDEPKKNKCLPC